MATFRDWLRSRDWRSFGQQAVITAAVFVGFGIGRISQPQSNMRKTVVAKQPELHTAQEGLQLRSTIAAENSFIASTVSACAASIGTILLIWTLVVTRSTARRQLRAYISVEPKTLNTFGQPNGTFKMAVTIHMKNGGNTPAYKCVHGGNIVVLTPEKERPFFLQSEDRQRLGEPSPSVIHSDQVSEGIIDGSEIFTKADFDEVAAGKRALFVFGAVEYVDTFGKSQRTEFCHKVDRDRFATGHLASLNKPGQTARIDWTLAPFHNNAT